MSSINTPSDFFQCMRTLGNLLTACRRRGRWYTRIKSRTFTPPISAMFDIRASLVASLSRFNSFSPEERAHWDATALLYYTRAVDLIIKMGWTSDLNSICGVCSSGAAVSGGTVKGG